MSISQNNDNNRRKPRTFGQVEVELVFKKGNEAKDQKEIEWEQNSNVGERFLLTRQNEYISYSSKLTRSQVSFLWISIHIRIVYISLVYTIRKSLKLIIDPVVIRFPETIIFTLGKDTILR